jgi:hypothetical protein
MYVQLTEKINNRDMSINSSFLHFEKSTFPFCGHNVKKYILPRTIPNKGVMFKEKGQEIPKAISMAQS